MNGKAEAPRLTHDAAGHLIGSDTVEKVQQSYEISLLYVDLQAFSAAVLVTMGDPDRVAALLHLATVVRDAIGDGDGELCEEYLLRRAAFRARLDHETEEIKDHVRASRRTARNVPV